MEKYSWSFSENDEIWRDSADSVEDCIYQAKEEADGKDVVYIGKNIAFVPCVDAKYVLESLQEQASDFAGDIGDDWDAYDYKTMRPALDELSVELTAAVVAWLKKHGRAPSFYQVENVSPHSLTKPAEED